MYFSQEAIRDFEVIHLQNCDITVRNFSALFMLFKDFPQRDQTGLHHEAVARLDTLRMKKSFALGNHHTMASVPLTSYVDQPVISNEDGDDELLVQGFLAKHQALADQNCLHPPMKQ